ncbi:MAG TPA: ABC transporter ATP-binding protein/permease [Azospirillaceae bacterium]|nr:ABC transporter ATP-binding protein/permease [Azospirillaceae bacterium]
MPTNAKTFLRDLWRLSLPYFVSEERWSARGLLASIIGLNLFQVYLNVVFNEWNGRFYDTLQNRDETRFWVELGIFGWLATVFIVAALASFYLNYTLQIRWRRWLTHLYAEQWLSELTYYRLQFSTQPTDNPDQRISEDIRLFISQTLTLTLGLLSAVVTLISFAGILWTLSGPATIPLMGTQITIPGYMVWAAVLYAVFGTVVTHLIGRRLIPINFEKEKVEADFRFALARFRENQEPIALIGGEDAEMRGFSKLFAAIVRNWKLFVTYNLRVLTFTTGFNQAAIIFPFLVGAPRFFAGTITLGQLMQISNAFGQVQNSLTFFVDAYTQLANWAATVRRLTTFEEAVREVRATQSAGARIERGTGDDPGLSIEHVRLDLPHGAGKLADADLTVAPGERVLVSGPSGSGKSTLFRAIAGLWPYGGGTVRLPAGARVMFVPQRPYLPIGTVKEIVCFPGDPAATQDADVHKALVDVGLSKLADRLDEHHHWAQRLSGGEQQRIGFARILLRRPDWIFLDEATSALDPESEAHLYRLVRERLPHATVVSVGHRESLTAFHERHYAMRPAGDGTAHLLPVGQA